MIRKLTCISCPVGCTIHVELSDQQSICRIEGHRCARGEASAREEITDPKRILTTSVKVVHGDYPLVSVRTDRPLPKRLIPKAMNIIRTVVVEAPVEIGQVLITNILGTGINVIATRTVRRSDANLQC